MTTQTVGRPARAVRTASRAGAWGLALAVFYAVFVRFYQAAGGTIGLGGSAPADPAALQAASYAAGLLILLGGVACLMLGYPLARCWPAWVPGVGARAVTPWLLVPLCAVPALVGGLFAVVHGLGGWSTKFLELVGVIDIAYPADAWVTLDVTAMDLWSVLFYEPWFLAMGVSLCLSVRAYARSLGIGEKALRRATRGCLGLVAAGTAVTVWMVVFDHVLVVGS